MQLAAAPYRASGLVLWHETDMPTAMRDVRSRGQSGKHILAVSFSEFDPKETLRANFDRLIPLAKGEGHRMRTPMLSVAEWLARLGLSEYTDRFVENDVDISVLHLLTDQDLKELGVSLGHR
jgi:hypothetical protein